MHALIVPELPSGLALALPPRASGEYASAMSTSPRPDDPWAWIALVGAGAPMEEAGASLARLIARASGAERAFVALASEAGVSRAWGADLEGLAVGEAEKRLPGELLASACGGSGVVYQRSVVTSGGSGSRLAASAPAGALTAVVVLEHRFVPGRFDAIAEDEVRHWSTCAALLARLGESRAVATPATLSAAEVSPAAGRPLLEATLQPVLEVRREFPAILGKSVALRQALARLDAAIDGELPVLVVGETGVGKELFARAVHELGARATAPFLAVNCAAIPDALFEAELFGHARGSFTGAERSRPGLFAQAEGGTLFLDEIGELSLARQATLLRVLETRRYRPVGADEERAANVRIVAATNRELAAAVAGGTFRQDLLYRLDVLRVRVPKLREREGDVPLLAQHFLIAAGSKSELSARALARLAAYDYPGNVRELQHVIQRLAALRVPRIDVAHLPREIRAAAETPESGPDAEKVEVTHALAAAGGNISRAAQALGLTRHGLKKRMVRLGMREPKAKTETS